MSDLVATANPVTLALLGTQVYCLMTALGLIVMLFVKSIRPGIVY